MVEPTPWPAPCQRRGRPANAVTTHFHLEALVVHRALR